MIWDEIILDPFSDEWTPPSLNEIRKEQQRIAELYVQEQRPCERVVPNISHAPKRAYTHNGDGVIICREVSSFEHMATEDKVTEGEILYEIKLSPRDAELLMEDLYYGEYTGA